MFNDKAKTGITSLVNKNSSDTKYKAPKLFITKKNNAGITNTKSNSLDISQDKKQSTDEHKILKQPFYIYFHDNFCDAKDENWTMETYIKSGEFKTYSDVMSFIDNYITNGIKMINYHQYRICFFANGFHPALDFYKGELNKDFGEFRIAIKFGMINNYLNSDSKEWKPTIFWQTYNNIPEVFKNMIILFTAINLDDYNLAGLTLVMKKDIVEFRWFIHTYEEEKYEKVKKLIKGLMTYLIENQKCPKTVKCYDLQHNLIF